jgi:hypothetical protein
VRINILKLRTIIADADAARAPIGPLYAKVRALRLARSQLKIRLDHPGTDEEKRKSIRAEVADLEKQIETIDTEIEQHQDRATATGRLATRCRDFARERGLLPPDLETN